MNEIARKEAGLQQKCAMFTKIGDSFGEVFEEETKMSSNFSTIMKYFFESSSVAE